MAKFRIGAAVAWKWPPGYVTGIVLESFTQTVKRTIKGKIITRHGSEENPAYLLRTKKGVDVLKLESELFSDEDPVAALKNQKSPKKRM